MTISEAIEMLKNIVPPLDIEIFCKTAKCYEALDVAIKSLEAWEKVKAEITEVEKAYGLDKATKYGNEDAEQQKLSYSMMMLYEVADLVGDIIDIIDKHLEEVESEG